MKSVFLAVVLLVLASFLACSNSADPTAGQIDADEGVLSKAGGVEIINAVVLSAAPDGKNFKWEVVKETDDLVVSVITGLKELKVDVGGREVVLTGKISSITMLQSKKNGTPGLGVIEKISGEYKVALPALSKAAGADFGECDGGEDCEELYGPPRIPYQWSCDEGACNLST